MGNQDETVIFSLSTQKRELKNKRHVEDAVKMLCPCNMLCWKSLKNMQRRALAEPSGITDIRFRRRSEESRSRNEHKEAFVQGEIASHDHYGREEESSLRRSDLKVVVELKVGGFEENNGVHQPWLASSNVAKIDHPSSFVV